MKRGNMLVLLSAFGAFLLFPSWGMAQYHCAQRLDDRNSLICAPPLGSMVQNINGKYVCGPGQCVILKSNGKVICSAAPGGLMALDTRSRGLCVGGCMEASEALCVSPISDPEQ